MYIPECRVAYHHKDGRIYSGNLKTSGLRARVFDRSGEISVTIDPPEPVRLISFTVSFHWTCEADERFFMNGFRSDSPCRERSRDNRAALLPSRMRKLLRVSAAASLFSKYDINNGSPMGVSYCYFRTARNVYRLAASDDDSNGYTIFQYDERDSRLYVSKDVEGVDVRPGEYRLMGIRIYDGDGDRVFDSWLGQLGVSPIRACGPEDGLCTAHLGAAVDYGSVIEAADGMKRLGEKAGLLAIYGGWQKAVGDWEPCDGKFASGMRKLTDEIHGKGLLTAIWFAPFAASRHSELLKEHPDRLLRDASGQTVVSPMNHDLAALDLQRTDVRDHIGHTFEKFTHEWGFDYVIAGDLYMAGLVPQKGHSRAREMYDAMTFLREAAGDTPIIAADVPLMPAFGLVEYCLLSTGARHTVLPEKASVRAVKDAVSAEKSECDCLYRRHLDGRAWISVPQELQCDVGGSGIKRELRRNRVLVRSMAGGLRMICGDIPADGGSFAEIVGAESGNRTLRRVFDKDRHTYADYSEGDEVKTVRIY